MFETLIGLSALILLLLARVPLGFGMLIVGFVGSAVVRSPNAALAGVSATIFDIAISPSFVVLPLFLLMGAFVAQARLSDDLYDAAYAWLGHFKGGLAMSTVAASGGFAAVSGNSVATVVTMAKVALPSMRRYGYSDKLAAGTIAAGGTLGILIPPSNALIIYGLLTESDVGKLFLAGMIPGIVTILLYIFVVRAIVTISPEQGPAGERSGWGTRFRLLLRVWGVVALFLMIMLGITFGVFTPTEAGAAGALGALLFAVGRRRISWHGLYLALFDAGKTTAMLFTVLFGALALNQFIQLSGVGDQLTDFVTGLEAGPMVSIFAILGILVVLGMFVEGLAMILLVVPIFVPIVDAMGFDLIWFGIFLVVASEISLITPPVGLNVFVLKTMLKDVDLSTIFAGIMPFFAADLFRLTLLIFFPQMALWLPSLF
ncbi:MAG: TRAP transporter large permease [Proteobacteria bacterium]|nr:TRAP transporter large permease [Pseudomonadota bacterium]